MEKHTPNEDLEILKTQACTKHKAAETAFFERRSDVRPLHHKPYVQLREIRLCAKEWVQNNRSMHGGVHFPLCVKFEGSKRRSLHAQQKRRYDQLYKRHVRPWRRPYQGNTWPSNWNTFYPTDMMQALFPYYPSELRGNRWGKDDSLCFTDPPLIHKTCDYIRRLGH